MTCWGDGMGKGLVTAELTGLREFLDGMGRLVEEFPAISREALKAQQTVVEQKVRDNWISTGGKAGDFIHSSVGQSTAFSKQNSADVVGTVGVYKMDAVNAQFGRTDKDLNAAQIAYWLEFGTTRLRSGARKKRGVEYRPEDLISTVPRSFISTAFYTSLPEQEEAFKKRFNQLVDRLMK